MSKKRRTYQPRIVGGKVMMPADLKRLRRVLAARRQHTENAELAAAIKFTQETAQYTVEDGGATRQAGARCGE